uniref:Uncharacterized protein AlNc14C98G5951 n=1 Tax=Albugo laibachii Nc14 TaxID=890382 RepID=F0WH86_9STRA|nr:conserved hypothetical protein [Albugo laibachii Nc14]|eukprot:CCA20601.1 conserved hypothetical protein [Albugo laibachii Nc14]
MSTIDTLHVREAPITTSNVRHLRSSGSSLHNITTGQHLTNHEIKPFAYFSQDSSVNEAFGLRKWPQLLSYLEKGDMTLRKNTLRCLTRILKNPQDASMCLRHGLLAFIERGIISSEDKEFQKLAAHVFSVVVECSNGRLEVSKAHRNNLDELDDGTTATLLDRIRPVFATLGISSDETSRATCLFLYDAFISLSQTCVGAQIITLHGFVSIILDHIRWSPKSVSNKSDIRIQAFHLLRNVVNDGLEATGALILDLEALQLCSKYLRHVNYHVQVGACDAIAAISYIDRAKQVALEFGVVKELSQLLTYANRKVQGACAGALMSLAINDEAKSVMISNNALLVMPQLLKCPEDSVKLNVLKLIAVVAAHPEARKQLNTSLIIDSLTSLIQLQDPLLSKPAKIALAVVEWRI